MDVPHLDCLLVAALITVKGLNHLILKPKQLDGITAVYVDVVFGHLAMALSKAIVGRSETIPTTFPLRSKSGLPLFWTKICVLICIIRRSLPNPASAEIVPTGNPIVITGSATCGARPPRKDAQAFGFSDDINNAKSDVSSNAIFVMCPPWEEVICRQSLATRPSARIWPSALTKKPMPTNSSSDF